MTEFSEPVLSTLNADGTRHWLKPRLSRGRFWIRRAVVAYFLMALFFVLPFLHIHGKPAVLLDIPHRHFIILGYTFLPTDTVLLALFMLSVFVAIFLFTALFGRLWCGWACPQTVYLEYLYRPLERLFDGTIGRGGWPKDSINPIRKAAYFVVAFVATLIPAHTFVAYFVGVDNLRQWMMSSPFQHPTAFIIMFITTVLMYFDFYFFREQLCILACPYGRFQSVLLDKWSMIVSYDRNRGEPRGKVVQLTVGQSRTGDCIDCGLCVQTCPTGIDIREGLQMECVNCTQCIDACDSVMDKIDRARGLIRYTSQWAMETGKRKLFRPRVVLYPLLLTTLFGIFLAVLINKSPVDVFLAHSAGNPYMTMPSGEIANSVRLKIVNRTEEAESYTLSIAGTGKARIIIAENPLVVAAGETRRLSEVQ